MAFCLILMGILMTVTGFLLRIQRPARFITFRDAIAERTLHAVLALGLLAVVTPPMATRIIMPVHGDSICHGLQGDTMYSSDWMRNTAWCVRDRPLEWVSAMAPRETAPGAAPQTASGIPP